MSRSRLTLSPTSLAHLADLHGRYRDEDEREAFSASRLSAEDAVLHSIRRSGMAVSVLDREGLAIAVFGVARPTMIGGIGVPWMMGTRDLDRYAREAVEVGREVVGAIRGHFELLRNHVDARNTRAIRWLRAVGFEVLPAEPYGAFGSPFHPFEMR